MIKFTDIINESQKQVYNGKVTMEELDDYITKVMLLHFAPNRQMHLY